MIDFNALGIGTQWVSTSSGIHTLSNVGVGTTNPIAAVTSANTGVLAAGIVTAHKFYGDGSQLTGIVVGSAGTWAVNSVGIHTNKNVGIGTTVSRDALTVIGNATISGIVTASRFESTTSGTPTIDSPNNLNINAVNVAISTDLTVGGDAYVGIGTTSGLVLTDSDGIQWRIGVTTTGTLFTTLV